MEARTMAVRRFNWKLAAVLVMGLVILAGTMWGLRQWRRGRLATQSLEIGMKAYDAKEWGTAARELGRYVAVHPKGLEAIPALLKYADAQLHVQPQKAESVRQAINAYRQILREYPEQTEASDRVSEIYLQVGMPADAAPILERRLAAAEDENARQLFALCKPEGINHLIYVGFAINWCLLLSPGGMADMSRHGFMCSTIREAVTAVENRETARDELCKQIALWRVALAFGLVFDLGDFLRAIGEARR